jgi:hypothetical protein
MKYLSLLFIESIQFLMNILLLVEPPKPENACVPTPCGPNAECQVRGESFACSCMQNYISVPPNCRPECTINPECAPHLACMQQRCRNPCDGICGVNAQCSVVNHNAVCSCNDNHKGDPFSLCQPISKGKYAARSAITLFAQLVLILHNFYFPLLFSSSVSLFACFAWGR